MYNDVILAIALVALGILSIIVAWRVLQGLTRVIAILILIILIFGTWLVL